MDKLKNYGGRPGRPPKAGERVHLGFRVTPRMKRQIESIAKQTGRSISQEAEFRLEQSFVRESAFGNKQSLDLVFKIATFFSDAGEQAARSNGVDSKVWLRDQHCYRAAVITLATALIEAMPSPTVSEKQLILEGIKGRLLTTMANAGELKFTFDDGEKS